jgi:hypothetical protein
MTSRAANTSSVAVHWLGRIPLYNGSLTDPAGDLLYVNASGFWPPGPRAPGSRAKHQPAPKQTGHAHAHRCARRAAVPRLAGPRRCYAAWAGPSKKKPRAEGAQRAAAANAVPIPDPRSSKGKGESDSAGPEPGCAPHAPLARHFVVAPASVALVISKARPEVRGGSGVGPGWFRGGSGAGPCLLLKRIGGHKRIIAICSKRLLRY